MCTSKQNPASACGCASVILRIHATMAGVRLSTVQSWVKEVCRYSGGMVKIQRSFGVCDAHVYTARLALSTQIA